MIPKRIYKRRAVWHWLADAGAPFWLWRMFRATHWQGCDACGWRGFGRYKGASSHGGRRSYPRYYCHSDCLRRGEGMR